MSYALTNSTWHNGYRIVAIIQFGIGMILLLTLPIWKINKSPKSEENTQKSIGILSALKIKGVPCLLLGFFGYCAAESTAMSWSCTYLVEVKKINEPTAAAFASSFFIGMTVGRFLGGFIMDRLGDCKMILLGTSILGIGVVLMMIPCVNYIISLIGLIICGLGCAPIYPCIIHSTPNNFGAEHSGAIIGIQMASAYLGSTLMAPLFGLIGKTFGFNLFPIYIAISAILMIIMLEKTFKITSK
jgi:fucose permease